MTVEAARALARRVKRPPKAFARLLGRLAGAGRALCRPERSGAGTVAALLRWLAAPDPAVPERLGARLERLGDRGAGHPAELAWAGLAARLRRRGHARALYARLAVPEVARAAAYAGLARLGADVGPELPGLLVHHHLGLGDHLICNGLVRHLARETPSIGLMVKTRNATSVGFMYRDLPGLRLLRVADDGEAEALLRAVPQVASLRVGFERLDTRDHSYAEDFYAQLGLPYDLRWSGQRIDRDPGREQALFERLVPGGGPYVFLHDDRSRGYLIDRRRVRTDLPVVVPPPAATDNIFDYGLVLERAAEIHCMDSSFRHLVDSLGEVGGARFLHGYVRPGDSPDRIPWQRLS